MKKSHFSVAFVLTLGLILSTSFSKAQNVFYVESSVTYVLPAHFSPIPSGGDTIKILASPEGPRETLKFVGFVGNESSPIVFINEGGQVYINTTAWGALEFKNCKFIKVTGTGDSNVHYGFKLTGGESCLTFSEYSSDCEAEFIEVEGTSETFFGIYAKKDFQGNPPIPYPLFNKLIIHDNYIHNVDEGIYIGETNSPGMEFRHLRVYNNIVTNTLRESIQIANSVDDIEIFNNLFLNAGIANLNNQNNGLQIGANSLANVHNNIIINSPSFGVIVLGNGDIKLKNNFLQNNKGVYIDDRFEILPYSSIQIEDNFFDQATNSQVIENRNEFTDLFIQNNNYNPNIIFLNNTVISSGIVDVENNQFLDITDFQYSITNGIFQNSSNNPTSYQTMGPIIGLGHTFNETPILQTIDNILIESSTNNIINLSASVEDQDILHFEGRDFPEFVQLIETISGEAELRINPLQEHVGVYEFGIMVYDDSHQVYDRQAVQLSVADTDNQAPELSFETNLNLEAASKLQLDITASDADGDELIYAITTLPSFAKIDYVDDQVFLNLQPKISDVGEYILEITADDAYGSPAIRSLNLSITQPILSNGRVIYRVNFGGPEILAEPINWESDIDSPVYGTTYFSRTGSWSWDGTNNTSAPNKLFGPFRYDKAGDTEMQFAFPLSAKGRYEVKLFFAERNTEVDAGIKGTFNVFLENEKVLYNFNIYQNAAYEANVQSFDVLVEDQILNLDFQQILNSSKINGVEISYLDEGLPPRDSERITLKKYMITDLVDGGSRYSPLYLVNEQKRDPFSKKQPKSKSWLPSKHISNSPFHIMLDLGEEYFIDFAFLHDMKFTADLNISSGKPDHWIEIATYTTSSFKKWKEVDLNTTSRYLLFSMYNTIYAQINEIALYGYAINQTDKSNIILNSDDSPDFVIYPNPAKNRIQIQNKIDDQIVEILNINGKVLFRTQDNSIDIADIPNGIYLLRLYYYEEVIFQDRFIKND